MWTMPHLECLSLLGFSTGWAAYLSAEEVADGCSRLRAGTLADPSGLRRQAFRRWVETGALDGGGLGTLLVLLEAEPDGAVREDAQRRLIRSSRLDGWRLELLKVHPLFSAPALQAELQRSSLLRAVREPEPEAELLQAALDSGDAELHQALLALSPLPSGVRAALVERGATRAIRQQARGGDEG